MPTKHAFPTSIALALCTVLGCGGSTPASKTPKRAQDDSKAAIPVKDDGLASVIATVSEGTLGPYIGYGPKGALAMYSPAPEEKGRRWLVQRLDEQGTALGDALDIGAAPDDVPFAVVRPVNEGYMALWVRQVHRADVLDGVLLGEEGSLLDTIHTVTQARGDVVWADAFGTSKGTMVLWTEQTGDRANLNRVMLDDHGKPEGNGDTLVRDVRAWEAVAVYDGAAVALVVANEQDPTLGSVVLLRVGADGKAKGEPVPISRGGSAQLDVGLVRTGRSLLMAWTDRSNADSLVHAAAADLNGKLMVAPREPLPPQGDQALVALIEPSAKDPNQALLVYEELPSKRKGPREVRIATLSSEALASEKTVSLNFAPVGRPLAVFGPTNDGFVLLTRSPVCDDQGACDKRRVPWYIRLSPKLTIQGAAPLLVDALDRKPPTVVWSPGCTSTTCMTLAVGGQDPARVVTAKLPEGTIAPGVPTRPIPPLAPPRPLSNRAVHISSEPLSRIDATTVGQTTFVGWVSHFAEGLGGSPRKPPPGVPGDPNKPMAAHLAVQRLDATGRLQGGPTTISVRAVSAGGVALAPNTKNDEVCVAWVGRDQGDSQLFLTRVGTDGKSKLQRMMTRAKGDAADVAIAPYGTGWIVAWVDWRDGNGEVYITRVNPMLVRLGAEKRITDAPGDASEVSLAVVGEEVLVAYGDSRDNPEQGTANPYIQKLRASNLERVGEERRISTSGLHAKGVKLSRLDEQLVASWVDQAPQGAEDVTQAGARVTRIDIGSLRTLGEMTNLGATGSAAPVALNLRCGQGVCRGAMMVPVAGGMNLDGFSWFPNTAEVQRGRLAHTSGAAVADITPVPIGDQVFFVDQGVDGENRLRRVQVEWVQ